MAKKPETNFRGRVSKDLKKLPHTAVFPIQQKTIIGDPDYMLCINGRFVGLELKSEKGKPSPLQKYKLNAIKEAGGFTAVAYPDIWGIVYEQLQLLAAGMQI